MPIQPSQLLTDAAAPLAMKRAMLRRSRQEVTTLALGSSHGDNAFDPGHCRGGFNLCSTSQDFRHAHAIYRRVAPGLPRLKNLVLFYSVFSPGHVLENSPSERHHCLAMHEILDLNISYQEPDLTREAGLFKEQWASWEPAVEGRRGFLPALPRWYYDGSYGADKRAADHLKLNRTNGALVYLVATLLLARRLNHQVLIVVPPARSDYTAACLARSQTLLRGLEDIETELQVGAEFQVLDLFGSPLFPDHHFGDFDHLDPLGDGVPVLSRKVGERLTA